MQPLQNVVACVHVCMYVCMYVRTYVCMYVNMYISMYMHVYTPFDYMYCMLCLLAAHMLYTIVLAWFAKVMCGNLDAACCHTYT